MAGEPAHIKRCLDLQEQDIAAAVVSRQGVRALLSHLAAVSAADTGGAKALLVLARMATTACDWLDGDLAIDLVAVGDTTRIDVATELGGGLKERVLPSLAFQVPLSEFVRAIERVSRMILPLRIRARSAQRVSLGATEVVRRTSLPPPPIEISADSLFLPLMPFILPAEGGDETSPASLPVIVPGLPIVTSPVPPAPPPAQRAASDPPGGDVDSGWDD
jgi:hypothetical protein